MSMFHFMKTSVAALLNPIKTVTIHSTIPTVRPEALSIIGTHDGSFHCDEALAVSMLLLHPNFKDSSAILRTRNPALLSQANVVVDVGAVYDPATHRYDHHQREFQGVLDGYNTRLSSAGLVYKHFGHDIIRTILQQLQSPYAEDAGFIEICYQKVYKDFMEHVDAIDNGISVSDGPLRYQISSTLSSRVGRLNPAWNELQSPEVINERFQEAMMLTCSEFIQHVYELATSWWPARSIVQDALDKRFEVDPSGKLLLFSQVAPWKDHLFELEDQTDASKLALYALYQDTAGSWRIQAVPVDPHSFNSRKKLPDVWCGLRDEVLSEKVGIPGCIFVHASGFIGGHQTKEGAIYMAKKALEL